MSPEPPSDRKIVLQARVDASLAKQAQALATSADSSSTVSDFVRQAIENEVSRRSLCKQSKPIEPIQMMQERLRAIETQQSRIEDEVRINSALLRLMCQALGLQAPG